MRFTDLFIRRPVLAVTISLMMVLFGLEAQDDIQSLYSALS
jgi:multidrug efflux pump